MSIVRFMVIEYCDDYEQVLALYTGPELPAGGILTWASGAIRRHAFPTRTDARAAINRTHHYAMAFGRKDLPDRKSCKVVPVNVP